MEPIQFGGSPTDGDSDLSFEALTFGDNHNTSGNAIDVGGVDESPRGLKYKKKSTNKKSALTMDLERDKGSAAVYISSVGDSKIDVQNLLKKLEQYGVVKAYYFKEKQDFGFVQFLDASVVDVVVENLNKNGLDGQPLSVERANGKSGGSALSFGGTPFSPSTPSVFSPSVASGVLSPVRAVSPVPSNEKPDTILVLKNLPFSLKQDQLQEILMQMNATAPQSINLHFDNAGVFKGMAFIKYRGIEDAIKVFDALNGYDVGGRKVRVEYKRKNKGQQPDIPQEWIEEDELKKVWDQVKDFSSNQTISEISFAPTLSNNQKKHLHVMADKLKLSHTSTGDQNSICIKKTPLSINILALELRDRSDSLGGMDSSRSRSDSFRSDGVRDRSDSVRDRSDSLRDSRDNIRDRSDSFRSDGVRERSDSLRDSRDRSDSNAFRNESIRDRSDSLRGDRNDSRGMDIGRGINISKVRGRTGSDARIGSPRDNAMSSDKEYRSPRNTSNFKQINGLSSADASADWRNSSPVGTPTQGGPLIAPIRQPKGPDGSKGFNEAYRNTRMKKAIVV